MLLTIGFECGIIKLQSILREDIISCGLRERVSQSSFKGNGKCPRFPHLKVEKKTKTHEFWQSALKAEWAKRLVNIRALGFGEIF